MKPYSLFKALLYSLTSITAARFGEIVIRASSRGSKKYRTALLVYLLLQITMLAWMSSFSHSVGILELQGKVDLSILMYKALILK